MLKSLKVFGKHIQWLLKSIQSNDCLICQRRFSIDNCSLLNWHLCSIIEFQLLTFIVVDGGKRWGRNAVQTKIGASQKLFPLVSLVNFLHWNDWIEFVQHSDVRRLPTCKLLFNHSLIFLSFFTLQSFNKKRSCFSASVFVAKLPAHWSPASFSNQKLQTHCNTTWSSNTIRIKKEQTWLPMHFICHGNEIRNRGNRAVAARMQWIKM